MRGGDVMVQVTKLDCLMRVVQADQAKVDATTREKEEHAEPHALARVEPGGRLAPARPHPLMRR